ncbi:MAG TPA: HD domain-containing protein [Ktedonobacteraceae bacterium]|nr:HD domain-containing protein [Ktedonobacteraceae bacterium]
MELPFQLETDLERKIAADPEWQEGVVWGWTRPGHSEGQIMYHIADVLANIDRFASTPEERRKLRLITLIHDTLKYQVNQSLPTGGNRHATIARRFAERYIDDPALLDIIELHDEAFNSWRDGAARGHWDKAEARVKRLIERLGPSLPLYVRFYRADNQTSSKKPDSLLWFEQFLRSRGFDVPPWPEQGNQ